MQIFCFDVKYTGRKSARKIRKLVLAEFIATNGGITVVSAKIRAIKKYRSLTGASLRDAKHYCDELEMKDIIMRKE